MLFISPPSSSPSFSVFLSRVLFLVCSVSIVIREKNTPFHTHAHIAHVYVCVCVFSLLVQAANNVSSPAGAQTPAGRSTTAGAGNGAGGSSGNPGGHTFVMK